MATIRPYRLLGYILVMILMGVSVTAQPAEATISYASFDITPEKRTLTTQELEQRLEQEDGVVNTDFSQQGSHLVVKYNSRLISKDRLLTIIKEAGFFTMAELEKQLEFDPKFDDVTASLDELAAQMEQLPDLNVELKESFLNKLEQDFGLEGKKLERKRQMIRELRQELDNNMQEQMPGPDLDEEAPKQELKQ
jgi:hypothetical protein